MFMVIISLYFPIWNQNYQQNILCKFPSGTPTSQPQIVTNVSHQKRIWKSRFKKKRTRYTPINETKNIFPITSHSNAKITFSKAINVMGHSYCKNMYLCIHICHSLNIVYKKPIISVTQDTNYYPIYRTPEFTTIANIVHTHVIWKKNRK